MHSHSLEPWEHEHNFSMPNKKGERRTRYVLLLTALTMVVEIIAGLLYGSVALLADGLHMGTHVVAFAVTLFAYYYARLNENNSAFTFGTGKVGVLGGFASAVILAVVALVMAIESLQRLIEPREIIFDSAIIVACIGLLINVVCAFLLKDDHSHSHGEHHHDHNLRAAYLHVLADALTSVLAIVALVAGKYWGWLWMDAAMGIVGAAVILRWSYGLLKETSPILLDNSISNEKVQSVRRSIEEDDDNRVTDLHIWRISAQHYAAAISIVTRDPKSAEHYKDLLKGYPEVVHITVETYKYISMGENS